jgi:hypothetical protein
MADKIKFHVKRVPAGSSMPDILFLVRQKTAHATEDARKSEII